MDNMNIKKVPTGHIIIKDGEKGMPLEFLSLGDYGQKKNVKADFLGLTDEISGVPHGDLLPLSEKWVITISSQYGCSMGCMFCDVPQVGPGINTTANDLVMQFETAFNLHPEVRSGRINLHYARMGEPTFNFDIFEATFRIKDILGEDFKFHPVISTMMPRGNKRLVEFMNRWMDYKNENDAGLQISINTTDPIIRDRIFNKNAHDIEVISRIMSMHIPPVSDAPKGRKITLNFALTGDEILADYLATFFDPDYFLCKITPMHLTNAVKTNKIGNDDGYYTFTPYREYEESLKKVGYDVIVFIPSLEEDQSKITCGNAILTERNLTHKLSGEGNEKPHPPRPQNRISR